MFKRTITTALAMALAMVTLAFPSGQAQAQHTTTVAPGVWSSAILIQNVSTTSATIEIKFYDSAGTLKKTYPTTLNAKEPVTLYVPDKMSDLASGQYSAVVSSTAKVIASVQTSSVSQGTGPWTAFAYEGVDSNSTGTKLFFPGNYKGYYTFNSELVIQNSSESTATTLTVDFYKQDGSKITTVDLGSLGANSAKTWAMTDSIFGALPSGNTGIFGAVVTSSATPIAGIANIWATSPTNKTASYNGVTSGTTSLFAPSLSNNYYGFASALTIQNIDQATTATGTIEYTNGTKQNFSLAPNAAQEFYQPNVSGLPSGNTGGSFSAKVTATAGSIVGLVSYSRPLAVDLAGRPFGDFASYNCAPVASAEVNIPNINNNYYGYFTNVTVQNTGTDTTDIKLTYPDGKTWTISGVAGGGNANFIHLPNVTTNPYAASTNISTSAVASSSNGSLLVAVIQHNTGAGVTGNNPAKVPSDFLQVFTGTPN
ncbi:hypothetical protein EKD04_005825 [Chloroflexales bacterium ZM16-3]|nr:hypothetical protein [Chloroflexales bacterium ZM16-3]